MHVGTPGTGFCSGGRETGLNLKRQEKIGIYSQIAALEGGGSVDEKLLSGNTKGKGRSG